MGIKGKNTEVLLDIGAVHNLLDLNTAKALELDMIKLSQNAFLRSVSGGKLPILAKATVPCTYGNNKKNLAFYIYRYTLSFIILGRYGINSSLSNCKRKSFTNIRYSY